MRKVVSLVSVCSLLLWAGSAGADTIVKPNTFTAGNPAVADEVNANFDTVYDQVNKVGATVNVDGATGNVGIGKSPTGNKLDVNGDVAATSFSGDGSNLTSLPVVCSGTPGPDSDGDGICDASDPCPNDPLNDQDFDGYCLSTGDCDDTRVEINMGAIEICDGLDNNCVGGVDEGLSADVDGDGFTAIGSCHGTANDPNDNDPDIFPAKTYSGADFALSDQNCPSGMVTGVDAAGAVTCAPDLVDDADASPTNELNSSVTMNGTTLEVYDNGGVNVKSVDLAETLALDNLSDAKYDTSSLFLGSGSGVNDDGINNSNTGIGKGALHDNTWGYYNTASGAGALYSNTKGRHNTASGYYALSDNTTAGMNTAIGESALKAQSYSNGDNNWNSNNTAVGYQALYSNQPTSTGNGVRNTALGSDALHYNTTGYYNTASGNQSLYTNTTGSANTASGDMALFANTTGTSNTASGAAALYSNTTAGLNTAIGKDALYSQSYSNNDTPWDSYNTAVGYQALYSNQPTSTDSGAWNTALGVRALYTNKTGAGNTASGFNALASNLGGDDNTATGTDALSMNTSGFNNTASGGSALFANTTGDGNTALGVGALDTNTIGNNNTAIGYGADVSANNLQNATAIGAGAIVNATNKVRVGDGNVTVIEGQVAWSYPSDERLKEGIEDSPLGLDFIKSLRPVAYRMKDGNERTDLGFIAQDIEALVGVDYNILGIGEDEERTLSLKYTHFIAPMVQAMQEQQAIIDAQQGLIESLKGLACLDHPEAEICR